MRTLNLLQAMRKGQGALACLQDSAVCQLADDMGLEVYPIGKHKLDPRILRHLLHLSRSKGFNIFDTQNPQSKFWGSLATLMSRTGLVSTLNSWYLNEHQGHWRGWFYHCIERISMPWTDRFIVVSTEIQQQLQAYSRAVNRLCLIPNAISLDKNFPHQTRQWLNTQYNLPANAIVCIAVGRLVEAKGYRHLIKALSRLGEHVHCLIIGDGYLKSELTMQITQLGMEKRVHLLGYQEPETVLTLVEIADIYVMASVTEGTPLALLEAGALAKPIVCTDVGGIPEIFHHQQQAVIVAAGDAQQLADGIFYLIQNTSKANRMAIEANDHIRKYFSLTAQLSATLNCYRQTLRE